MDVNDLLEVSEPSRLIKSKYAYLVKTSSEKHIVYSVLSGAVLLFTQDDYITRIVEIFENGAVDDAVDELIGVLKEKKILINSNTNEDLFVRTLYEENIVRNRTLELTLIVTKQCNFRCTYCGQPFVNQSMKAETYEAVINFVKRQLIEYGYRAVQVSFFGGEPLLEHKEIITFLENLSEMIKEFDGIDYSATMTTNAYLLIPSIFDKLVSLKCTHFQISVDGMDYTHNNTRVLVNGGETWNQIMNNIEYATSTDSNFSIVLRTNFNFDVADSLIEFYEYVKTRFNADERVVIYYETVKDHGIESAPEMLNALEGMILSSEISKILGEHKLPSMNVNRLCLPLSRVCYASKPNHFIFDEENRIMKCTFVMDSDYNHIGLLNGDGSFDIDGEKHSKWVYNDYLNSDKCINCKILPLCLGKTCPNQKIINGEINCGNEILVSEIEESLVNYFSL